MTISLVERVAALQRGTELASGRLPDGLLSDAERVLARAGLTVARDNLGRGVDRNISGPPER